MFLIANPTSVGPRAEALGQGLACRPGEESDCANSAGWGVATTPHPGPHPAEWPAGQALAQGLGPRAKRRGGGYQDPESVIRDPIPSNLCAAWRARVASTPTNPSTLLRSKPPLEHSRWIYPSKSWSHEECALSLCAKMATRCSAPRGCHALEVLPRPFARPPGPAGNVRKLKTIVKTVRKRAKATEDDQNRPDPPDRPRPFARR